MIFISIDIHENTPVLKRVVYQRKKLAECLVEGFHFTYKEVDSKVTKPRTEAATQPQPPSLAVLAIQNHTASAFFNTRNYII